MRRSSTRRKSPFLPILLLSGVFLVIAYSAASYYAGVLAEQKIRQYAQMPSSPGSVQIRVIEHQTGVWQSSGVLALENSGATQTPETRVQAMADKIPSQTSPGDDSVRRSGHLTPSGDSGTSGTSAVTSPHTHAVTMLDLTTGTTLAAHLPAQHELPALIVRYQINHTLWPTRLAQVSWTAQPSEVMMRTSGSNLTPPIEMTGAGVLNWKGGFESRLAAPPFVFRSDDHHLSISAMSGYLAIDQQRLQIQAQWPRIQGQSQRPDLDLENLTLKVDTADRFAGLGISTIEIDKIQWDSITAHQVMMSGQTIQPRLPAGIASARINLDLSARAQSLNIPGYELQSVVLDGVLRDLDVQSIRELQRIWNETAGLQLLMPTDLVRLRQAVRTLVLQGINAEITEVSVKTESGEVSGQAVLDLQGVDSVERTHPGQPIDFEKYLRSRGELRIQGQGVSPALTTLGLLTGFLTRTTDGVKATYDLSDGKLQISGKALPAQPVYMLLNRLLNNWVVMGSARQ